MTTSSDLQKDKQSKPSELDHETQVEQSWLNRIRNRSWLQKIRDRFWGYDFFISYHWESGGKYAVNLAQRLVDEKYGSVSV